MVNKILFYSKTPQRSSKGLLWGKRRRSQDLLHIGDMRTGGFIITGRTFYHSFFRIYNTSTIVKKYTYAFTILENSNLVRYLQISTKC